MDFEKPRIAVLGGGIGGTVVANSLAKSGLFQVDLLERNPDLGGIHRSVNKGGVEYDVGTFVFPEASPIFTAFPEVEHLFARSRFAPEAVRLPGRVDRYPMSIKKYADDVGILQAILDFAQILPGKILRFRKRNLVEHIEYYIGSGIYRRAGLKAYIQRLYQLNDGKIDLQFAVQRLEYLKYFGFRSQVRRLRGHLHGFVAQMWTFVTHRSDPSGAAKTGDKQAGTVSREPGTPCRIRPKEGFGPIYRVIRGVLESHGVCVKTTVEIQSIEKTEAGFEIDGVPYDGIVSTIPIPALARCLGMPVAARFEYVNLVTLFYRFRGDPGFDASVLFNYSPEARWKRITLFSRYYERLDGEDYFSVECILKDRDDVDPEFLKLDFETHVAHYGLFTGHLRYEGCVVSPNAYPVFHAGEMEKIRQARDRIETFGIHLVGRQGTFEYLSSEQTATAALKFADGWIKGGFPSRRPVTATV